MNSQLKLVVVLALATACALAVFYSSALATPKSRALPEPAPAPRSHDTPPATTPATTPVLTAEPTPPAGGAAGEVSTLAGGVGGGKLRLPPETTGSQTSGQLQPPSPTHAATPSPGAVSMDMPSLPDVPQLPDVRHWATPLADLTAARLDERDADLIMHAATGEAASLIRYVRTARTSAVAA